MKTNKSNNTRKVVASCTALTALLGIAATTPLHTLAQKVAPVALILGTLGPIVFPPRGTQGTKVRREPLRRRKPIAMKEETLK